MKVTSAGPPDCVAGADVVTVAGADVDRVVAGEFREWLPELHATSVPNNAMVSRAAAGRRRAAACWTAWLPIAGPDAAFISVGSILKTFMACLPRMATAGVT